MKKRLQPIVILFMGVLITILIGAGLLSLPFATKEGTSVTFLDSLFVATSAACVTGLTPVNTAATWSLFGQVVILVLIQIGGLGFMTFISLIFMLFRRRLGIYGQSIVMQSAGTFSIALVKPLIKKIVIGSFIFETLGAALLTFFFWPQHGVDSIWYGVFHSISAFCNAGFDIFGDSLMSYSGNIGVIVTISMLVIIGGLGFIVWHDIVAAKGKFSSFQMHTKIVLIATLFLVFLPAGIFYLLEFTKIGNLAAYGDISIQERILDALFLSVSPRTAGFNSVDLNSLTSGSKALTMVLMFIGGNSGSTAGGVKVTTLIVIILNLVANSRGKEEATVFKQRIPSKIISQASALLFSYLFMFVVGSIIICSVDSASTFESALFESISAIATVGLTLDLTAKLGIASKIVIIILMYVGRLGALALFDFLLGKSSVEPLKHPEGRIMVG